MSVLTSIQDQLRHVDELIAHFEHAAIEHPRPSIAANIRALEKERRIDAKFSQVIEFKDRSGFVRSKITCGSDCTILHNSAQLP
jgi:hypothetical protein